MLLTSLLLLSMVMAAPLDRAAQTTPSVEPAPAVVSAQNSPLLEKTGAPPQSFRSTPAEPPTEGTPMMSDDVCYKIRAYIFKRDDDHAPELVRSTTCGPRQPHAKDAIWPKAKLVPAK